MNNNIIKLNNGDVLIKDKCTLSEIYEWLSHNPNDFEEILYLHKEKLNELQKDKALLKIFAEKVIQEINYIIKNYSNYKDYIVISKEFEILVNEVVLSEFDNSYYIDCPHIEQNYLYEINDINASTLKIFNQIFNVYQKVEKPFCNC